MKAPDEEFTPYNQFKEDAKNPTVTHFSELIKHHQWLMSFGDMQPYTEGISKIKLAQFAEEARSLDATHIKNMRNFNKKYSLMASLLHEAQRQAKDSLATTLIKTTKSADKAAQRQYQKLTEEQDTLPLSLAELLANITGYYQDNRDDAEKLAVLMDKQYEFYGGSEKIMADCGKVIARHTRKHLPLVWRQFKSKRPIVLKCLDEICLGGNKNVQPLLQALELFQRNAKRKAEWIDGNELEDSSCIPGDWKTLVQPKEGGDINRHHFEVVIIDELAERLNAGDIYLAGAEAYGNYRRDLLSWDECLPLLDDFCDSANIPNSGSRMVKELKENLMSQAKSVDKKYPKIGELSIEDGVPTLKRRVRQDKMQDKKLLNEIRSRMPERRLLDILCLTNECTEWAHCFAPLSGSDPKLKDPLAANIVTTFGYGTRMGSAETARHVRSAINERTIGLVNKSHVNLKKLAKAIGRVVDYYQGFPLIKAWGTGERANVDGSLQSIYEQNLLAEMHIRYGAKGGIAYHHVADNYIALFSSMIPCGVWEAVAIIDGLLNNQSSVKPTKIHGDTQAQSAPVFGFGYLFGIRIMPRIRNWKHIRFFRPMDDAKYKHIDSLFKGTVNWQLIEDNWQDMMQLILSIQHGKVSAKLVLKRLGTRSKKNHLYRAFRELGRVLRTIFLLEYISDVKLRETITAETNKVEAFHNLSDWVSFASRFVVSSNNITEMEKAIRYNTLVTNLVILQNVIDMSEVIQQLRGEGWTITKKELASLSPYLTEHIKRFGDYILDLLVKNINLEKIRAMELAA